MQTVKAACAAGAVLAVLSALPSRGASLEAISLLNAVRDGSIALQALVVEVQGLRADVSDLKRELRDLRGGYTNLSDIKEAIEGGPSRVRQAPPAAPFPQTKGGQTGRERVCESIGRMAEMDERSGLKPPASIREALVACQKLKAGTAQSSDLLAIDNILQRLSDDFRWKP